MARWEPNAQQRLQQAAGALFAERGYADVTVADIAERAGLTKRTFFNHFPDKREVLFADAAVFEASVLKHLAEADPALAPLDAAVEALAGAGLSDLAKYGEYAGIRRDLIASSTELQERDLIKTAALTAAIAAGLLEREAPPRTAAFASRAAVAVFSAACDDWIDAPAANFATLMSEELAELRHAVGGTTTFRAAVERSPE